MAQIVTGGGVSAAAGRAAVLAVALASLAMATAASAQDTACRQLQARLARLEANPIGGSGAQYRKWDSDVAAQRQAISRTERQARAGNCRINGRAGFGAPHPECGKIEKALSQMTANLAKLERRRDRYGGDQRRTEYAKREIRQRMHGLRCGDDRRAGPGDRNDFPNKAGRGGVHFSSRGPDALPSEPRRRRGGGLLALLFGAPVRDARPPGGRDRFYSREEMPRRRYYEDYGPAEEDFWDDFSRGPFMGTYRTMCVRRCDGYYFPISFSTTEELFGRDADMCSQLCPGGDAELYVHENPGGSPEEMTALDGRAYTELPAAFKYRREFDKSCTCQSAYGKVTTLSRLHLGNGPIEVRKQPQAEGQPAPDMAVPVPKRPRDLDPDSRINVIGDYRPAEQRQPVETVDTGERTIRIVGPRYFYAQ